VSTRIGGEAFKVALARDALREKAGNFASRKSAKVEVCHKSNVLSVTDGLFRTSVRSVYEKDQAATGGPGRFQSIALDEQLVDSMVYRRGVRKRTRVDKADGCELSMRKRDSAASRSSDGLEGLVFVG
jgi:isocitrate/isopropylmalate dehydrogenase